MNRNRDLMPVDSYLRHSDRKHVDRWHHEREAHEQHCSETYRRPKKASERFPAPDRPTVAK